VILDISHIALQVPDLEASVDFAVRTLGMLEVERIGERAYLTHASPYASLGRVCDHHVVEYVAGAVAAFDHVGFVVAGGEELEQVGIRAEAAGGRIISRDPQEPALGAATRLMAPSGHIFEIHSKMETVNREYVPRGLLPRRLGHVNFLTRDVPTFMRFLVDALGFQISDWVSDADGPMAGFARCHFDHHTLAATSSPIDGLHHAAFETVSPVEIGLLGDHLARAGRQYLWGPGRHGAGDNIAAYFSGVDDIVIEIYADMQRIVGDSWQPRSWSLDDPRLVNMWTTPTGLEPLTARRIPLSATSVVPPTGSAEVDADPLGLEVGI
jgi:catechol 2,3-dioxygenase-like lactoylglutathione lyase family enzyme